MSSLEAGMFHRFTAPLALVANGFFLVVSQKRRQLVGREKSKFTPLFFLKHVWRRPLLLLLLLSLPEWLNFCKWLTVLDLFRPLARSYSTACHLAPICLFRMLLLSTRQCTLYIPSLCIALQVTVSFYLADWRAFRPGIDPNCVQPKKDWRSVLKAKFGTGEDLLRVAVSPGKNRFNF